jgi:hypothetical protein
MMSGNLQQQLFKILMLLEGLLEICVRLRLLCYSPTGQTEIVKEKEQHQRRLSLGAVNRNEFSLTCWNKNVFYRVCEWGATYHNYSIINS